MAVKMTNEEIRNSHLHLFSARINYEDRGIEVFAVGKWRSVRWYSGNKNIPGTYIQQEMVRTLAWNVPIAHNHLVRFKWVSPNYEITDPEVYTLSRYFKVVKGIETLTIQLVTEVPDAR
jgi:hypothetical protein